MVKTTLVDRILYQVHLFRANQQMGDLILDSNDLERERGITIYPKNVSVRYKGVKIISSTLPATPISEGKWKGCSIWPMAFLLLVDAFEGPMPQTRFVWTKPWNSGRSLLLSSIRWISRLLTR